MEGKGESIFMSIPMSTSIHIPRPLLEAVDRKARILRISRNRLVVRALEREVARGSDWPSGFFEQLAQVDDDVAASVDEVLLAIRAARHSKEPQRL
jgi:predicted transcriptional regulator